MPRSDGSASSLEARELPLTKIFGGDFAFRIPFYQRPYSWTREQVDELLDDLTNAANAAPVVPYFLGSIVLVKPHKDAPPLAMLWMVNNA